ncbi:MAG TPA: SpaA isopeptide-forming pilin-related protein [Candidatus Baltobacteraceae bacterium]|nr:SpaA isopeptide-forming pilin-related protein [Candidatus Baltobacteraceae bacterium]
MFALILFSFLPPPAVSCSMIGCAGDGKEMRHTFTVKVVHSGKPLTGVTVRIARSGEGGDEKFFLGTTGADGAVHITNLPPGHYWIYTDLLGISAGTNCFHVSNPSTPKASKSLNYEWGDLAPATRSMQGILVDSQPGQTGNPIERLLHRVDVPIPNTNLTLHDPFNRSAITASTDDTGKFSFSGISTGTYVLHIDSGIAPGGREYDSSDILIVLADKARLDTLRLVRREAGSGSCGGTSLELR